MISHRTRKIAILREQPLSNSNWLDMIEDPLTHEVLFVPYPSVKEFTEWLRSNDLKEYIRWVRWRNNGGKLDPSEFG